MTLLLNAKNVEMEEEDIKKIYKYNFELVDRKTLDSMMRIQAEGYAGVLFINRAGGKTEPFIANLKDGREMARSLSDWSTGVSVSVSTPAIDALKKQLNKGVFRKDDFKIIAKQIKD